MKLIKTRMMTGYLFKFGFRIVVFVSFLLMYIFNRESLWQMANSSIVLGVTPVHVLWAILMLIMISHLFPNQYRSMALRREKREHFDEVEGYSQLELLTFLKEQNTRAWKVLLVWLTLNAVIGLLYLFDILIESDLLMISVFFFLCDYICILIFCPFQSFIMKNKCCVNCRIYDWGHFMMLTPMLFIQNFYSWSLFFTSLIVLISWEIKYAQTPERFWAGSNKTLKCANCKDKTCQIKRKVTKNKGLITD